MWRIIVAAGSRELETCIRDGGYSLSDLDDLVRRFPKGLVGRDGFYGLMIKRLKERQGGNRLHIARTRRIFAFLLFAERRVLMTELRDILAIPFHSIGAEAISSFDLSRRRPLDIEHGVYSHTGGLVEVISQTCRIRFVDNDCIIGVKRSERGGIRAAHSSDCQRVPPSK